MMNTMMRKLMITVASAVVAITAMTATAATVAQASEVKLVVSSVSQAKNTVYRGGKVTMANAVYTGKAPKIKNAVLRNAKVKTVQTKKACAC